MAKVKLSQERYEEQLHELQVELCLLQRYVREKALRMIEYEKVKFHAPDLGSRKPRKKGTLKSIRFKHSVPETY